ncbi:FAD/NAD(P)-binding oxidoreductase [Paraburkholderia sp. BL10I2N1]|uniref:FAD/NAD(P)-dependent oxidoreductase n=1 Tax=Paraburkholderia sp. BL10I2N1 TaxID=1938796 RepID=UPI00105C673E|nr:FAD/NAD(P)-binding oxidoreductase [Paraburkholderia sp. BL10I2N1]TDN62461.1 NADPH-dependent 2,4-dienoyl-CoA reductase/sulfur reductase-like enzyme [Paraburkholderia sp. BL10I2N1]
MSAQQRIVIVGAGPAGVRAAETLVAAGLTPVVIDENARWGGQIYRQPPLDAGFIRSKKSLYGFEARKADALHSTMAGLVRWVNYRPDTLAWACEGGRLDTLHAGREGSVPFSHLIIASGATDRVLPIPGWTLPGVYTMGGAQVALKAQGCAIGQRVVLAGTGPLLYLVAYQYVKAGARIEAVLDTSAFSQQLAAAPKLARQPRTFAKGLYYVGWLQARGVRVERSVTLAGITGERFVTGISWKRGHGAAQTIECDAVGLGFGLRPETQLADLAGCRFRFDAHNRCWLPELDAAGRSSVARIYLAGDGAGIAGADAAELAGRRAALALLDDLGIEHPHGSAMPDVATLERKLQHIAVFRAGIEAAFAPPEHCASQWPDDMTVCRCEEVDAGTLRRCIRAGEASEINRLKALTRVGMGRCQGRMCGEAAIALLSEETGRPPEAVGRIRSQPPVKPIPMSPALYDDGVAAIPQEARDE